MTAEYFFLNLKPPIIWKPNGWNHVRDPETKEIISYGKVFDDRQNQRIIRFSFTVSSERVGITERTRVNGKTKYKTVCDVRTLEELNNYISIHYLHEKNS